MLNALLVKFGLEGVMGYFRPTSGFNVGKKQEFSDRKYFSEKASMTHCEGAKDKAEE